MWPRGCNNESERMLRKGVITKKIRFEIVGRGRKMFLNTMARVLTWRGRNLNMSGMLLKVLNGT